MSTVPQLRAWSRVVLAVFLAGNALPRPSLYAHHHAGGDHVHVHAWGEDADAETPHHHHDGDDHDEDDLDDDHHDHAAVPADGPVFDEPGGGHGTHVHWQSPFQRATRPPAPLVVPVTVARRAAAVGSLPPGSAWAPPASARAPPPDRR